MKHLRGPVRPDDQRTAFRGQARDDRGGSVSGDPFFSLKAKRLSDSAVEEILGLIREGKLELGSRLPSERELITRLAVSRSSLREAIRMLEATGVLVVRPGRGTWIRDDYRRPARDGWLSWLPHHQKDVTELLEMREPLEVQAASLSAERGTANQLAAVEAAWADMQRAARADDPEALAAADTSLHEAIAEASGNTILAQTLRSLSELVMDTRRAIMRIPGHPRRVIAEHGPIVRAIVAHDSEGAAKTMFKHVRSAREDVALALSDGMTLKDAMALNAREHEKEVDD
jgi:GntR family transcriptional repressor for pyruvate dehydrogenase complex